MNTRLDRMPEWQSLKNHARSVKNRRIAALFERDGARFENFSATGAGLLLDYSKQNMDARTRDLLLALASATGLSTWRSRLFRGDPINVTEGRAVLHTALRATYGRARSLTPASAMETVQHLHDRMERFVEAVRSGRWQGHSGKRIETVVNLGIGGSDLGPAMVCTALARRGDSPLDVRFVSNVDPQHLESGLSQADPETTLFIVASKTFTTTETMANARGARRWLLHALGEPGAVQRHFVAVTSKPDRAREFGVASDNIFPMADWIGGRFSLWSTIGLPIALQVGMSGFRDMLRGAARMDDHFLEAPLNANLPVLMAMTGIWNRNFRGAESLAIVPYAQRLELLPAYLQQLEMESNGKQTTRYGEPVSWDTSPVIWGATGTNGQHAFFQQLHQGTREVPVDFVLVRRDSSGNEASQRILLANGIAQSAALMQGRDPSEVRRRLVRAGKPAAEINELVSHRSYPGNRPSSTLVIDELNPESLGALIALYEHKTFVQGVVWQICSFDQWGVELGKELASDVESSLAGADEQAAAMDGSSRGLVAYLRGPP